MPTYKRLQNRIAENALILPFMAVFTSGVWLLCGLITQKWWIQFLCFAASVYLMVETSNSNALLRVRSRMVSAVFMALSCAACFLFGSLTVSIVQLCFITSLLLLFHTYQDKQSSGLTFYSFLCIGLSSLVFPQIIFFVPLIWLLMGTQLQSLSIRTWLASVVGVLTPYWLLLPYLLYLQDFSWLYQHVTALASFTPSSQAMPAMMSAGRIAVFIFIVLLCLTGIIHFWHRSFEDKIRIRLLYGFFTCMSLGTIAFMLLQPQHFDTLLCMLTVCASPLIAHFLTLTNSRLTNIVFIACVVITLLLIVLHFVEPWIGSLSMQISTLWNGLLTS